ncbi:ATP-dependent 3'-5' DNA helicase [Coemansia sp. BCRC 34962]|nr:ATP-dependent 3'-5' DNA helicase [Coemansia sp. BCRC 34962]
MDSLLLPLRSRFKAFATVCVFIALKTSDSGIPIRVQSILQSVPSLTTNDIAVFSGILGSQVLRLFWDFDQSPNDNIDLDRAANSSQHLYASLYAPLQSEPSPPINTDQKRPAKRPRRSQPPKTSDPIRQVTALLSLFDSSIDALFGKAACYESLVARLARENMPQQILAPAGQMSELSMDDLATGLPRQPFYRGQIVSSATLVEPAVEAQHADLQGPSKVHSSVWTALHETRGIEQLYSHQAQAIDLIMEGHDAVVSTATASGKSVIYQLPILDLLLRDAQARILIIYPTKALAQDQLASLKELVAAVPALQHVLVSTLDGDTPSAPNSAGNGSLRTAIRQSASVILTNPDTLHVAMLPGVDRWQPFWACLRMVVIDELHVYQGRLGQHFAHILSRLQRLSTRLQFVACSATTSNPQTHMEQLTHRPDIKVVSSDGSPHGARHLVLWDSLHEPRKPILFRDTAYIAGYLLRHGKRAIVFCKSRRACELALREITDYLDTSEELRPFRSQIMSYRGGYTLQERREIEAAMFSGRLHMVIATSALELGIDVGSLDAVVMVGMPITTASFWQQAGRAGRRSQTALALVIATGTQVDRHVVASAGDGQAVFDRCFAPAEITHDPDVSKEHLQCAAFERPIDVEGDDSQFVRDICGSSSELVGKALTWDAATLRWACPLSCKPCPAAKVSIRSSRPTSEDCWLVVAIANGSQRNAGRRILEEVEATRAMFELYEGGIFLHRGHTYAIELIDADTRTALVTCANVSWHTAKREYLDVVPELALASALPWPHVQYTFGDVEIATTGIGYRRIDSRTRKVVEVVDRMTPRLLAKSRGVWIDLPADIIRKLVQSCYSFEASVHGARHALLSAIGITMGCASTQLSTMCSGHETHHHRAKPPCLVVFELVPTAEEGPLLRSVSESRDIIERAFRRVSSCTCGSGCTECVHLSSGCREQNLGIDRAGAKLILQWLTNDLLTELPT